MSMSKEEMKHVNEEFKRYKKQAVEAATDLGYDKMIVTRLRNARNSAEITNIMNTARSNMK